jgi:uncharacterized membrane protein
LAGAEHSLSEFTLDTKGITMPDTKPSGFSDNTIAALAYITFVPAVAFLVLKPYNKSSYVRYHAWQSIFLSCVFYMATTLLGMAVKPVLFIGTFPYLVITWLIWGIWVLVWILCALKALNGKRIKLPVLGTLAERQAAD